MKTFNILVIFWTNNWSESETISEQFNSTTEANEWCERMSTMVNEEFPKGSNSYYKNGTEYRLLGEGQ